MTFLRFISFPIQTFEFLEQALGAHELVLGLDPLLRRVVQIIIHEVGYLVDLIEIVLFLHAGAFARQKLIVRHLRHIDLQPYLVRIALLRHGVFVDGRLVLAHLSLVFTVLAHE